jgi:hypothetical protein
MARRARLCSPLLHLAILALLAAGVSCQFQPDELPGGPGVPPDASPPIDTPPAAIDASPIDASPIDASPIDAALPPDAGPPPDALPLPASDELVNRGLLTRYFIDEATDGTEPLVLEDSAPDPLPLTIDYAGEGEFIDDGGNRGLRWNALTDQGQAAALLAEDSKVWEGLDGTTTGTIELVVDIDQFVDGSRLSHVGESDDSGVFTLRIESAGVLAFSWNNATGGRATWNIDLVTRGRTVLHLVLDTGRNNANERVRLYADGVEQTSSGGAPPDRNLAIDIVTGSLTEHVLANRAAGERGIAGTFYYASMYTAALEPAEVAHNFDILDVNDDGPDAEGD